MKTLYFQTECGASGDMILSALIGCGVPVDYLAKGLSAAGIEKLSIKANRVKDTGIESFQLDLNYEESSEYRNISKILDIIKRGGYSETVLNRCVKVLTRLAEAEARVHGVPVEKVHFHEIGAIDTIIDILGAALCLEYLKIDDISFSSFTTGSGMIKTAHGVMPVPAPATAEIIKGYKSKDTGIETEILTPTGAAILTSLGEQTDRIPDGKISVIGYGSGTKRFKGYPNVLRAFVIDTTVSDKANEGEVLVLETCIDNVSGEIMGFTAEQLFDIGALDVYYSPIFMKKGRPAYMLTVLCQTEKKDACIECMIKNTGTLGIRYRKSKRVEASREAVKIKWHDREIDGKRCEYNGKSFLKPEYEGLAEYARENGMPLIDVIQDYMMEDRRS